MFKRREDMKHHIAMIFLLMVPSLVNACCLTNAGTVYDLNCSSSEFATFSPNGSYLAAIGNCGASSKIVIFNVTGSALSGMTSTSVPGGVTSCSSVAFSPNGQYIASSNLNPSSVTLFPFNNGVVGAGTLYPLPSGSISPHSIAFSSDGNYIVTANDADVTIFRVTSGVLDSGTSYTLPGGTTPGRAVFSPNGLYLATANGSSNDVTIFSVTNGVLNSGVTYPLPSGSLDSTGVVFSPDGAYLAVSDGNSDQVTLFTVTNGVLNAGTSYPIPAQPSGLQYPFWISFSPDGQCVAVAHGLGLSLFNVSNGVLGAGTYYSLPSGQGHSASVAFSPNGSNLVTADNESGAVCMFSVGCSATGITQATVTSGVSTSTTTSDALTLGGRNAIIAVLCALGVHGLF